jgi:hypothetical protein
MTIIVNAPRTVYEFTNPPSLIFCPHSIQKLNELSIFANYGTVLGSHLSKMDIWERQNEIVCSPWNWAAVMSKGNAALMEGGVEAQYLDMGRCVD